MLKRRILKVVVTTFIILCVTMLIAAFGAMIERLLEAREAEMQDYFVTTIFFSFAKAGAIIVTILLMAATMIGSHLLYDQLIDSPRRRKFAENQDWFVQLKDVIPQTCTLFMDVIPLEGGLSLIKLHLIHNSKVVMTFFFDWEHSVFYYVQKNDEGDEIGKNFITLNQLFERIYQFKLKQSTTYEKRN